MCVVDYAHNIIEATQSRYIKSMNAMNRFYYGAILLKIIVDYREKASGLIDLLKNEGCFIEVKKVSHGDYIITDIRANRFANQIRLAAEDLKFIAA